MSPFPIQTEIAYVCLTVWKIDLLTVLVGMYVRMYVCCGIKQFIVFFVNDFFWIAPTITTWDILTYIYKSNINIDLHVRVFVIHYKNKIFVTIVLPNHKQTHGFLERYFFQWKPGQNKTITLSFFNGEKTTNYENKTFLWNVFSCFLYFFNKTFRYLLPQIYVCDNNGTSFHYECHCSWVTFKLILCECAHTYIRVCMYVSLISEWCALANVSLDGICHTFIVSMRMFNFPFFYQTMKGIRTSSRSLRKLPVSKCVPQ